MASGQPGAVRATEALKFRFGLLLGCDGDQARARYGERFGDLLSNWRQDHDGLCVPRNLILAP
jgi:hypothetical protein